MDVERPSLLSLYLQPMGASSSNGGQSPPGSNSILKPMAAWPRGPRIAKVAMRLKLKTLPLLNYFGNGPRVSLKDLLSLVRHPFRKRYQREELLPQYRVLRTIQAGQPHCVRDDRTKEWIVSSGAFSPSQNGFMSVDLEQLLCADGKAMEFLFPNLPRAVALVAHVLGDYLDRGLMVDHQPIPLNYYHGGVSGKLTRGVRRKLAESYEVICPIDVEQAEALASPPAIIQ